MPLMLDGTGMCGACRCSVGGEIKYGCVQGPEFDGQQVDWRLLIERMRSYLDDETTARPALEALGAAAWTTALDYLFDEAKTTRFTPA